MFCACCFVIVVSYCCCVVSLPTLHPPPPPPHSDPPNLVYPVITVMASPSLLPSSSPPSPPLPFVHPLTSIFLSSVCVCPFCDVIPEDTDSPSWTNSGLSLLLLDLLSFLTQPPLLLLLLFIPYVFLACPPPPTSPHLNRLFFSRFARILWCRLRSLFCRGRFWRLCHFALFLFCCRQTVYAYNS